MQPINRQDKEDDEIGNHHREVEGVCVIDARKSLIRDLVPVMADGILCREKYRE
jgi:hypothetical protein